MNRYLIIFLASGIPMSIITGILISHRYGLEKGIISGIISGLITGSVLVIIPGFLHSGL